jgi:hypothetical protein
MSFVMAEIAVQRLIQYGIQELRKDEEAFRDIFAYLVEHPLMVNGYGTSHVDKIWQWFNTEKIPVVQAWLLTAERVPCFSIHLSTESEDESKAALSDFYGEDDDADIGINSFVVNLDVGIHGSKTADQVLWMYYIASYILFRYKDVGRSLGLQIHTYSATDWQKDTAKNPENVFTRWIRMRVSTFNNWKFEKYQGPYEIETEVNVDNVEVQLDQVEIDEL